MGPIGSRSRGPRLAEGIPSAFRTCARRPANIPWSQHNKHFHSRGNDPAMLQEIAPIAVRPSTLTKAQ
jgi:hypothetical protein